MVLCPRPSLRSLCEFLGRKDVFLEVASEVYRGTRTNPRKFLGTLNFGRSQIPGSFGISSGFEKGRYRGRQEVHIDNMLFQTQLMHQTQKCRSNMSRSKRFFHGKGSNQSMGTVAFQSDAADHGFFGQTNNERFVHRGKIRYGQVATMQQGTDAGKIDIQGRAKVLVIHEAMGLSGRLEGVAPSLRIRQNESPGKKSPPRTRTRSAYPRTSHEVMTKTGRDLRASRVFEAEHRNHPSPPENPGVPPLCGEVGIQFKAPSGSGVHPPSPLSPPLGPMAWERCWPIPPWLQASGSELLQEQRRSWYRMALSEEKSLPRVSSSLALRKDLDLRMYSASHLV